MFKRLVAAMGQPELSTDPAYATHTARGSNQAVLDQIIADWTAVFDREALGRVLDEAGVPRGSYVWHLPTSNHRAVVRVHRMVQTHAWIRLRIT